MNKYMEVAKRLAEENIIKNEGHPFGACVVKDGKIIGKGSNNVKSNNDPTAHAEIVAIRDACKTLNTHKLNGCVLYTTSHPCPMCLSTIIWSRIKKVYYGNSIEDAEKTGCKDAFVYEYIKKLTNGIHDSEVLDLECIDREETIKVFNKYVSNKDKKN